MEGGANFKFASYVNTLKETPFGARASLPDCITKNHGLANVSGDDSLHFFRCSAVYQGANTRRCKREAKKLFNDYCVHFNVGSNDFVGVNLFDFVGLENFFKINLIAYELEESAAKLIHRSRELYSETMKLNIWKNHLSLIADFEHYYGIYKCIHCDKLWDCNCNYCKH